MAIDRTATLKNAEKLLRQGKIEPAIAEYVRMVADSPRDWNLANTLGDLYVRADQLDKAAEQFTRIADSLLAEGFLPKASAIYKKILKLTPEREHALLQAAEIAATLGLLVDARLYFGQIVSRRQSRGDAQGVAQARIRLGSLDPGDIDARRAAARARVEIGDPAGAARDFKDLAADLLEKGRAAEAIEALREAVTLAPDDDQIRQRLLKVYIGAGDFAGARASASTPDQLKGLAAALEAAGHQDVALQVLGDAARLDPADNDLCARLAKALIARGDVQGAAQFLTVETAGDDPHLLLSVAEAQFRSDRPEDGLAIVRGLLERFPDRREEVAFLGWTMAGDAPEYGFRIVELAADAAVTGQDWASAAAALQEFVTRVPNHVPALMRLVEICVDGGLEATMYSAQAHLADAYIAMGQAAEARFIAEDLVAREPWDRSNLERFRRALELLGEPDPEAVIADRLSGQSPFTTTDLFLEARQAEGAGNEASEPSAQTESAASTAGEPSSQSQPEPPAVLPVELSAAPALELPPPAQRAAKPSTRPNRDLFELSSNAIDLDSILGELESPPAVAHASTESVEVDLSIVLNDIKRPQQRPDPPSAARASTPDDVDGVFAHLREDASRRSEVAEQEYQRALALYGAGDLDNCIPAFEAASRAPRLRFATASVLARIFRDRGMRAQAIDWYEKAAQAPPPSAVEGHDLLYDLADVLEKEGEIARALAISIELQADAGVFRDIAERIDRLTKVQARG